MDILRFIIPPLKIFPDPFKKPDNLVDGIPHEVCQYKTNVGVYPAERKGVSFAFSILGQG
jgi:hypothetical protein